MRSNSRNRFVSSSVTLSGYRENATINIKVKNFMISQMKVLNIFAVLFVALNWQANLYTKLVKLSKIWHFF